MPIGRSKDKDYKSLSATGRTAHLHESDIPSLSSSAFQNEATKVESSGLANLSRSLVEADPKPEYIGDKKNSSVAPAQAIPEADVKVSHSEKKVQKKAAEDKELLSSDRWLVRNGHMFTYVGLFLFSFMVLFRPYELVPGLGFLAATAFYFALATLAIYAPSQIATEGNLTMLSTEVKAVLAMTGIALLTMPIAKDPGLAWEIFNDPYIKAVLIFIVLVNVVRTRKRLMGMMWLSFGIAVYLGFSAMDQYMKGQFTVEEYRVGVDVGGMFGNPNEMAMHFVMMTPLVIVLGIASKGKVMRVVYFGMAALFIAANMVTFSRGGFLGLLVCLGVLSWKLGRRYRLNVTLVSIVGGLALILAAPGNYGLRMLSIFIPGLDAVGSSDQRQELLIRSLLVTARNPWGIGIGNFPIVGVRNLQSHNAFTQVSAELGILGLIAYLVFILSPFRKLAAIERALFEAEDQSWFYYLAIGFQASIIGYMVSSFFASVAYNWFIYYLIAYAVAFRRIYSLETGLVDETVTEKGAEPAGNAVFA